MNGVNVSEKCCNPVFALAVIRYSPLSSSSWRLRIIAVPIEVEPIGRGWTLPESRSQHGDRNTFRSTLCRKRAPRAMRQTRTRVNISENCYKSGMRRALSGLWRLRNTSGMRPCRGAKALGYGMQSPPARAMADYFLKDHQPSLRTGKPLPHRGRFFGKPLRAIYRFRHQDAQTPPSPLVGEGVERGGI